MSYPRQHAYSDPSFMVNLASHRQTFPQFQAHDMNSFPPSSDMQHTDTMQDHLFWDNSFVDDPTAALPSYPSMDHTASPATVTPIDLLINTPSTFQPTPDSDNFDSPGPLYSNDTSPFFTMQESPADYTLNFDASAAPKNMFPELPGYDVQAPSTNPATIGDTQVPLVNSAAAMSHKATGQSPGKSPRGSRSSLSSGVKKPKPKKRQGKLKEMFCVDGDVAGEKRCRNTLAARNSRARKAHKMDTLGVQAAKWKRRCFELGWTGEDDDEVEVEE